LGWQGEAAKNERAKVEMIAVIDPRCDAAFPLFIGTENKSSRRVEQVYFTIRAFRSGFSNAVYTDSYKSSDRIIEPGQGWGTCWSLVQEKLGAFDPKTLDWQVELLSVSFSD
jgi:hypothetical protein